MKIRIKTKLTLGLIFLFGIIILVGTIGGYYSHRIGKESEDILADNYESISYVMGMLKALDKIGQGDALAVSAFEENLTEQEKNITEPGEKQLTDQVRHLFTKYVSERSGLQVQDIRKSLYGIMDLNMKDIGEKNEKVQQTSSSVLSLLAVISTFCILITLTFIINFPAYIANPIKELTESIKQIANKNYSQRLDFKSNDEFDELAQAFNTMAQKLDEYEHTNLAEILFEKKRIDTIINHMPDGIIGLDERNKLLFANPVACELLGMRSRELTGRAADEIAEANELMKTLISEIDHNASSIKTKPLKINVRSKDLYFVQEVLKVTNNEETDTRVIGHVVILKNVTEFREQDAAKTNFMATISHELKTPIASIRMSTKLLEDERIGEMNEEQKKLIEHIKDDSQRLLKITRELLDLAQVEMGKIQLNFQKVSPAAIINYATEALRLQADQKKVRFEVDSPVDLPEVNADMEKSAWVMVNLLSNAIRYSPEGKTVAISAHRDNGNVRFSVKDQGEGIDPKYRERIFEKFFQVPGSKRAGTGLGLAISKEFIQSQGGKIWVESEVGKGSEFMFTLRCLP